MCVEICLVCFTIIKKTLMTKFMITEICNCTSVFNEVEPVRISLPLILFNDFVTAKVVCTNNDTYWVYIHTIYHTPIHFKHILIINLNY